MLAKNCFICKMLVLFSVIFVSCAAIEGVAESSGSSDSSSRTSVWSGWTDLADSWTNNIQLDRSLFSSIEEGDTIEVEHYSSSKSVSYIKLKLYYTAATWIELTGGSYTNASYDSVNTGISLDSANQITSYRVTRDNAENLRNYGFALNGYGLSIKNIRIVKGQSASQADSSDSSSPAAEVPVPATSSSSPLAKHGKLHVKASGLYDEHNKKFQLYGMSTHGLSWFPEYVNKNAFADLRDKWNTNCVRLVLYPKDYNGYCTGGNKSELKALVCKGIEAAAEAGLYVIVDWHVHNYNPEETQSQAIAFLSEISAKYSNYKNVLYEICNEPTNSPWDTAIKPYAQSVISAIRKNARDAVIIVGTNTWSQDIEGPLASPLDPNVYGNIMYTFHFYANSHKEDFRARVENAIKKGLPIFITEFGTCDASGNGGFNSYQTNEWFKLIKKYNISHLNWSLCNKGESASAIKSSVNKTSGWKTSDLTESGLLIYNHFKSLEP